MADRDDRERADGLTDTWRHPLPVRLTHWVNAFCVLILVMSGLQILNAHPHLYWGLKSTFDDPWISTGRIAGWLTLPGYQDLATGRRWHFFFAWLFVINGLIYLAWITVSGRLKRMLAPSREELVGIGHSVIEHARLHFPEGEAARRYNVIQKLTYLFVLLVLLPLMLVTGLGMSPGMNAAWPWLLDILGGRQSARTLHFLSASGIVIFALVHVLLVILSGFANNMRSMLTGWYAIRTGAKPVVESDEESVDET